MIDNILIELLTGISIMIGVVDVKINRITESERTVSEINDNMEKTLLEWMINMFIQWCKLHLFDSSLIQHLNASG